MHAYLYKSNASTPSPQTLSFPAKVKSFLFPLYYEILKKRTINFMYATFMFIPVFLQLIGSYFYHKLEFPNNDSIDSIISEVLEILLIIPKIEAQQNKVGFYLFVCGSWIYLIGYISCIAYMCISIFKIRRLYFIFPISILRNLTNWILWPLFIPMVLVFLNGLKCSGRFHHIDSSLECNSMAHVLLCLLMGLGLFLLLIISILGCCFYNNSNRHSKGDVLIRADINFDIKFLIYRFIFCILITYFQGERNHPILVSIHLLGGGYFFIHYWRYIPFYKKPVSELYGIGIGCYLWTTIAFLCLELFEATGVTITNGLSPLIIIGYILIGPFIKEFREILINSKVLKVKYTNVHNEIFVDLYLQKINEFIDQRGHNSQTIILKGLLANHHLECFNPNCPLVTTNDIYHPKTNSVSYYVTRKNQPYSDPILLIHWLASLYKVHASFKPNPFLDKIYAEFMFDRIGNFHQALLHLNNAELIEESLQRHFSIFRSKKLIEKYLKSRFDLKNEEDSSSCVLFETRFENVFVHERLLSQYRSALDKSALLYKEFWIQLLNESVNLNQLNRTGADIVNQNTHVQKIWENLHNLNPISIKALRARGEYLIYIKHDEHLGFECREKVLQAIQKHNSLHGHGSCVKSELMFLEDTTIITMSAETQNLGKISNASQGIIKLFGYRPIDVHGRNINILMPKLFGEKHQQILINYFNDGRETSFTSFIKVFGINKRECLVPIHVSVKILTSIEEGIQYIGLIRPRETDSDFILTNTLGKIDSLTEELTETLNLTPAFCRENEVYIQLLCPELLEVVFNDATKDFCTKYEILHDYNHLTFVVPENFIAKLNQFRNEKREIKEETKKNKEKREKKKKQKKTVTFSNSIRKVFSQESALLKKMDKRGSLFNLIFSKSSDEMKVWADNNILFQVERSCQILDQTFCKGELHIKVVKVFREINDHTFIQHKNINECFAEKYMNKGTNESSSTVSKKNSLRSLRDSPIPPRKSLFKLKSNSLRSQRSNNSDETPFSFRLENLESSGRQDLVDVNTKVDIFVSTIDTDVIFSKGKETEPEMITNFNDLKTQGKSPDEVKLILKQTQEKAILNSKKDQLKDDLLSVSSSSRSIIRQKKSLQTFLYDDYYPTNLRNIRLSAFLVFITVIGTMSLLLYSQLQSLSEIEIILDLMNEIYKRSLSLTFIHTSILSLIGLRNEKISLRERDYDYNLVGLFPTLEELNSSDYKSWNLEGLKIFANQLQTSQDTISDHKRELNEETYSHINPSTIILTYSYENDNILFSPEFWNTMIIFQTSCYQISQFNDSSLSFSQITIKMLLENTYNSLFPSIENSTEALVSELNFMTENNEAIMLSILIFSLVVFVIIMIGVIPLIISIKKNKENILRIFLEVPHQQILDEIMSCNKYFISRKENEGTQITVETQQNSIEKEELINESSKNSEENEETAILQPYFSKRKFKKHSLSFSVQYFTIIGKFLIFGLLIICYYIVCFVYSEIFLSHSKTQIDEMSLIYQFNIYNTLAYGFVFYVLSTEGNASIYDQSGIAYSLERITNMIENEGSLNQIHNEHQKYPNEEYNSYFDSILTSNLCEFIFPEDTECSEFFGGILTAGLKPSSLLFLNQFYSLLLDFSDAIRSESASSSTFINDSRIIKSEILLRKYLTQIYHKLAQHLRSCLDLKISNFNLTNKWLFVCFLIILCIGYIFGWKKFLETTRHSLFETKKILTILAPEMILNNETISKFLSNESKGLLKI